MTQLNTIGYTTLSEWEANTPHHLFAPGSSPDSNRAELPVYLTVTSQVVNGSPSSLRSTLRVGRLDEQGHLHYWQLHLATVPTFDGASAMFPPDQVLLDSGQTAHDVVKAWLEAHGFKHIVAAQVALPKDLSLLDGHTDLLRFVKDQGWRPL